MCYSSGFINVAASKVLQVTKLATFQAFANLHCKPLQEYSMALPQPMVLSPRAPAFSLTHPFQYGSLVVSSLTKPSTSADTRIIHPN